MGAGRVVEKKTAGAFDIVALAASAGGLKALSHILAALPADFPAAIVVVQHLDPSHRSMMADILRRSADLLFESVAASYKERAVAVVLSGTGSDGSMGVRAIKKMGGTVVVQDEKSAEFSGMPSAAMHTGCVDLVLPLEEIPGALAALVRSKEPPHE